VGAGSVFQIFDEKYYAELDGGILEAVGRMFAKDLRLLVYPMLDLASGKVVTASNLELQGGIAPLYRYLLERGSIVELGDYDPAVLPILPRDVLRLIKLGDPSWEDMVPQEIADVIKTRRYFGLPVRG
jgi:hypothetical protein